MRPRISSGDQSEGTPHTRPRRVSLNDGIKALRPLSARRRMRLGHCSPLMHLAKLRIRDSSVCECGLDDEDLNHIFLSCALYDHHHLLNSPRLWCPSPN
ncbi:hypothetical protein EVAR_25216_1 [Eumeta japonica]|uniref:Uncharacterized protein n=1 Tax=Eumeta variegata TaxID=151549 RepID=A0A4C1WJL0_EUMVA|nr:hypothetical protein EVAR_25216_1 [Eumeta japonica]